MIATRHTISWIAPWIRSDNVRHSKLHNLTARFDARCSSIPTNTRTGKIEVEQLWSSIRLFNDSVGCVQP